jgi:hypothetical protein
MTHFPVAVILPKDADQEFADDIVHKLMMPYDEELQVPPYKRRCWCVESKAYAALEAKEDEFDAKIKELRKSFEPIEESIRAKYPNAPKEFDPFDPYLSEDQEREYFIMSDELDFAWTQHIKEFTEYREAEKARLENEVEPDQDCEECGGTGLQVTTYNPRSKWDWYEVGGRWHGDFDPTDQQRDVLLVEEMVPRPPYAYITPDGEWHERGLVGWFGVFSNEKSLGDWSNEWREVRERFSGHYCVIVDAHI